MMSGQYWFYHGHGGACRAEVMHVECDVSGPGTPAIVTACGEEDGSTLQEMEEQGWIMGEPALPPDHEQTRELSRRVSSLLSALDEARRRLRRVSRYARHAADCPGVSVPDEWRESGTCR